jgi:hypothetical protein
MRHTHDTTFSEKILDFYKILEESDQFFILFFKENGKSEAVFPQVLKDRKKSRIFSEKVVSCVCRINILPSPLKFSISIKK